MIVRHALQDRIRADPTVSAAAALLLKECQMRQPVSQRPNLRLAARVEVFVFFEE
jgi:hypothetical protein